MNFLFFYEERAVRIETDQCAKENNFCCDFHYSYAY